jgi:CRISPR-associated endonuclease Csn1
VVWEGRSREAPPYPDSTPLPNGKNIRRVRVGKEAGSSIAIRARQSGAPYKWLLPEENHHVDVVSLRDGAWRFYWASVFDVNRADWRPEWETARVGGKLVMRLHKGDCISVQETEKEVRRFLVIHQLDSGNDRLFAADPNEGGGLEKRRKDKDDVFQWIQLTAAKLKLWQAVAVRVDEIGNVHAKRSNL